MFAAAILCFANGDVSAALSRYLGGNRLTELTYGGDLSYYLYGVAVLAKLTTTVATSSSSHNVNAVDDTLLCAQ